MHFCDMVTSTPPITTIIPIATKSGSSCVSISTTTICLIPRDPCVPSAVCNSWVATPTPTPTPTTTTKKPSPTPTADCSSRKVHNLYYEFEIYNIDGWVSDRGGSLKDQEEGCGALTGWEWSDADSDTPAYAKFNLPLWMKSGCVERAIASAGGPKISCQNGGGGHAGNQLNQLYQPDQPRDFDSFYRNMQSEAPLSSDATYVPMDWGTTTATSPSMTLSMAL